MKQDNDFPAFDNWEDIEAHYQSFSDLDEQLDCLKDLGYRLKIELEDIKFNVNPENRAFQKRQYEEAEGALSKQEEYENEEWIEAQEYKLAKLKKNEVKIEHTIKYLKDEKAYLTDDSSVKKIQWTETTRSLIDYTIELDDQGYIRCNRIGKFIRDHFIDQDGKPISNEYVNKEINAMKYTLSGRSSHADKIDGTFERMRLKKDQRGET